jgi:Zn-dependent protease
MESSTAASPEHAAIPDTPPARHKGRPLPRILSGFVLTIGVLLLKLKAVLFVAFEWFRPFLVNPFEGFSATQFWVAGGSMSLSIAAYAAQFTMPFAIGFVVLIMIHEVGHAVVIRAKGLRAGVMVFIPFVGGAVTLKDQPRSVYDDAQIGLAGPFAGTIASLVVLQLFKWTGEPVYLRLAAAGFLLNLLNMLPIGMLDGGRISAAITKWMWVIGGAMLVYKTWSQPNPLMIAIVVLIGFQVYASIVREDEKEFYEITGAHRAAVAVAYFSLVLFLGHQTWMAFAKLKLH